jgi:hypothetical protein
LSRTCARTYERSSSCSSFASAIATSDSAAVSVLFASLSMNAVSLRSACANAATSISKL